MPASHTQKWFLILTSIILGLLIIPSLFLVMFSPMLFDSPEAGNNPITWGIFLSIVSFPFITFACIVIAWILYAKNKYKAAIITLLIPILNIISLVVFVVLLQVYCDGVLSC